LRGLNGIYEMTSSKTRAAAFRASKTSIGTNFSTIRYADQEKYGKYTPFAGWQVGELTGFSESSRRS
jgi:hypothetical protein